MLWTTGYGITLDVKLGIVVLMILFGAHNRYLKLPRLLHATGKPVPASVFGILLGGFAPAGNSPGETTVVVRSCARAVLAEAVLGVAVIVAASVLLHGMPPAEMPKAMAGMSMSMNSSRANPLAGAAVLLRSAPVALSDGRAT